MRARRVPDATSSHPTSNALSDCLPILDDECRRRPRQDVRCHRIGLVLSGAVGLADGDLALRRWRPALLLHGVRQLMRHQPDIISALSGPQKHIGAVGERARPQRF